MSVAVKPQHSGVKERLLKIKPITQNNQHITWQFETNSDVLLFKRALRNDVIKSSEFIVNKCKFYLELTPNGWGNVNGAIIWCALKELPEEYVAVMVQFKYKCDDISFEGSKKQILTTQTTELTNVGYSMSLDNAMLSQRFTNLNSFTFNCAITVIAFYTKNDLENIAVQNNGNNISDNKLMKTIKWNFENISDVQLFKNSKHDNVINSPCFILNGCKFHLELTPNGWGGIPKGECLVWLAVESFAQKAIDAEISYSLSCDEVGYSQQKTEKLSDRRTALTGNYSIGPSITDNWMKINQFNDLKQWEFKMYIE
eukprot:275327_1